MIEICQINLLRGEKDMYNVGDEVVYPMHGAGRIVAIEEREVMEEKQSYYILEMPGEVKVKIPTATAEEHGIRSVINKEEAQRPYRKNDIITHSTSRAWASNGPTKCRACIASWDRSC